MRFSLLVAIVVSACGHDDPAPIARVVDAGVSRIDAAAPLPAPHRDPTFRFVKADATVDRAGDLVRPAPWIPDEPELEALLPSAPITALEEVWARVEAHGISPDALSPATRLLHRVQLTVTSSDGAAMQDAIIALQRRLTPRDDAPPTLTFEDPALGTQIVDSVAKVAWGDLRGHALFAGLDPKADGRTFELALGVIGPGDEPALVANLAKPAFDHFAKLVAAAGPITSVRYAREVGRPPELEVSGLRPVTAAESAAVQKIIDAGNIDTMDHDAALIGRVEDPRTAAWSSALVRALLHAGFKKTDEPHTYRSATATFLIIDDSWTLFVGGRP